MHTSNSFNSAPHLSNTNPSLQGGGGGPTESDVTGLIVRSTAHQWAKNSVLAIDPGTLLGSMATIIDKHLLGAIEYKPVRAPSASEVARAHTRRASAINIAGGLNGAEDNEPKLLMTTGPFKGMILRSP